MYCSLWQSYFLLRPPFKWLLKRTSWREVAGLRNPGAVGKFNDCSVFLGTGTTTRVSASLRCVRTADGIREDGQRRWDLKDVPSSTPSCCGGVTRMKESRSWHGTPRRRCIGTTHFGMTRPTTLIMLATSRAKNSCSTLSLTT